jgi:hypothetical protein
LARSGEDQLRFIMPLYSTVVFFPFALIADMELAQALWMTFLEASLILLAYFSIRLVNWRPGLTSGILFFLFSLFWFHSFQPLLEGDSIILVALMIVGALVAIRNGTDELAGLLLGFATIQITSILFPLIFILLWAAGRKRWTIVGWVSGTVVLLSAIAALLLPNWIMQNIWQFISYLGEGEPGNIRAVLIGLNPELGGRIGYALMAVLAIVVIAEWIFLRNAEFRGFLWAVFLTITAGLWIGPVTDPGNFILALPALPLVFSLWEERWRFGRFISIIAMLALFAGLWGLYLPSAGWEFSRSLALTFFFPLPIFLLIVLYWVRWWAVRPEMWFDLIYQRENPGRL